jgi:hypothetical protein
MGIKKRNYNPGLAVFIIGYLTVISCVCAIYSVVETGINIMSYALVGAFGLLLLSSGVLLFYFIF